MSHKALLEIGTEEIPAKLINEIYENIESVTGDILNQFRIKCKDIKVLSAPRRLCLLLEDINEYQSDLVEEKKGPPCNIAYDDDGNPTKAATGFARGQGLEVEDLEIRETEKGEYLFAVIHREGKPVIDLLGQIYEDIITSLNFPITMRWGNYDLEFIRPIHWLLGLFDDQVIDFKVGEIESGNYTKGHRFLANEKIVVEDVESYFQKLRDNYVIVDPEARKEMIVEGIREIESEISGKVEIDQKLLQEVNHLVEYPTPFVGSYAEKYLQMPDPVLVTPIKEHQRYFIIRDEKGELLPGFIGVRDGAAKHIEIVCEGNEKVLKARLDDAEFYYEKDLKVEMDDRVEELKDLVFIEELGSMYDKVQRIKELSGFLCQKMGLSEDQKRQTLRAATLAKADLVSQMVREFSELQGIIGKEYAKLEGEPEAVCTAISEHYKPRFAGDDLPETTTGRIISVTDKLDTLIGTFGIGMIPTGSEDPYGLRRSAMGLIRILKEAEIDISLEELINRGLATFKDKTELKRPAGEIADDVLNFCLERVEYLLSEQGVEYDVIKAVTTDVYGNIPDIFTRAHIYREIRDQKEFEELVIAYTRVDSIIGDWQGEKVKEDLFVDKTEKELYEVYKDARINIDKYLESASYIRVYQELKKLITPIHEFFETVMVMAKEEEIKNNRLNLLMVISDLMSEIGDLSEIVVE